MINGGVDPILREVARIVNHPEYNAALIAQDVCVVRVTTPFVWTANVQPIRVGSEFIGGGVTAIVSGWGGTAVTGGPLPNNLQWLTKQTLTNADCATRMGANAHFVLASKICTFTQAGQGICQGDSGEKLIYLKKFNDLIEILKKVVPSLPEEPSLVLLAGTSHVLVDLLMDMIVYHTGTTGLTPTLLIEF